MTRSDLRLVVAIVSTAVLSAGAAAMIAHALAPQPDLEGLGRRLAKLEATALAHDKALDTRIASLEAVAAAACTVDSCILRNFEPACCANVERPAPEEACDEVSCVLTNYEGACCAKFDKRLPDALDRAMISEGVAAVRGGVGACGNRSNAKGMVRVRVKVGPDGKVASVTVATAPDPALGVCVAAQIQRASFRATRNGGMFSYPFVF